MDRSVLNLLLVFDAVFEEGNLTRAGFRLGISQSAVSHAIGRLRKVTGDALFVRVPSGVEPTPYAQNMAATVRGGIGLLQSALDSPDNFDPSKCKKNIQILLSDIGELLYLPDLMNRLRSEAPWMTVRVLQMPREEYPNALASGVADLAIGYLPGLKAGIFQQRLFSGGKYVCIARTNHPRVRSPLTREVFLNELHISVEPAGSPHQNAAPQTSTASFIEEHLVHEDLPRRIALRVPHFNVVPEIVRRTDLIAISSAEVLQHIEATAGLQMLELPFEMGLYAIRQFWHQRNHDDPAHRWIRAIVSDLFQE
ncbi:LysR family transcriptional regulator [Variovorax paradoxus]|uniref:LysR family transcriptional regulator n=1 Tax=Variovorax paradoxus TaxID=34073 RepID=UPI003ECEEEC0